MAVFPLRKFQAECFQNIELEVFVTEIVRYGKIFSGTLYVIRLTWEFNRDRNSD